MGPYLANVLSSFFLSDGQAHAGIAENEYYGCKNNFVAWHLKNCSQPDMGDS